MAGIAIAVAVGGPAESAAVGQGYRHSEAAGGDHLPEGRLRLDVGQRLQQLFDVGQGEALEHPGVGADLHRTRGLGRQGGEQIKGGVHDGAGMWLILAAQRI
ncbi:hypothetical protein D3C80_1856600 [compost metagenome]